PSPQTDRVVALVDLMAGRPEQAFTLAELTRRLGVHKQTCHSMLVSLTDAGWLVRHPTTKTYRLGPKLIRAGRAAAAHAPLVDHAHPTMHALAQDVDAHCLLLEDVGDSLVILDAASPRGRPLAPLSVGQSFPMRAPFGGMFTFWRDEAAFEAWTAAVPADEVEVFGRARAVARADGFEVRLDPPFDVSDLRRRLGDDTDVLLEEVRRMLGQVDQLHEPLDPAARYPVVLVSAPIVDDDGDVGHALSLSFRSGVELTGAEVRRAGEAVREAAVEISRLVGARSAGF
ncbi:MAG: transcriptional regulator, IclR family, partial [Actinomycetia bacterium]|nr:transcriptional regulator, IclR family [Actinomycetes bacterium]